ncbi:MAG TPA: polysaccharide biosynthesis/export family protein [Alphaproteobacteria bacterium]|nr:polysaccharide biosynthesis/export family protein [Alphaproteobacteria bacterium]
MTLSNLMRGSLAALMMITLAACGSTKKQTPVAQPQMQQQQYVQPQPQMTPQGYYPQQTQVQAQTTDLYRLGSGDEIRLTVFGEESMTGNYKVDGAGMISLPLVGNVQAGNLTVAELQMRIAQHLSQGFLLNPRVSVQVMNYRPFFILGEVNRPNQYPYVEGMKVINAVAVAGGYTYRANERSMTIVRGNDPTRSKQPADPTTIVMPGDTIEIQERFF